jgi:hypothetical protein
MQENSILRDQLIETAKSKKLRNSVQFNKLGLQIESMSQQLRDMVMEKERSAIYTTVLETKLQKITDSNIRLKIESKQHKDKIVKL